MMKEESNHYIPAEDSEKYIHYQESVYSVSVLCGLVGRVMIGSSEQVTCPECLARLKEKANEAHE